MGCLASKEKYRVHERESERRIKSYRAAGKQQQPAHYSGQVLDTEQLGGDTLVKTRQQSGESERRTAADCDRNTATTTTPGRERGDTRGDGGDKAGDCTPATAAATAAGFGSRNTFDRASQLRRSRKKSRRRSDAADTTVTPRRKSDAADATLSPSTAAAEKMARSARVLSESLDQSSATNTTTVSTLSRLHEQTFTNRAEYSSNYGNLI